MNNNYIIKIIIIFILIISEAFADSIKLDSDNIKVFEEGNLIHAFNAKAFDKEQQVEIVGDKSIYDKKKSVLTIIENVRIYD